MTAYYNEIDPFAAQWLRMLIAEGHIAPGIVDERSIEDVTPADLKGFTQCHFFAGIGVWSYALRRAGWPDDRSVWTGSCPCQPYSSAGKGGGFDDERHLWPAWYHLIQHGKPADVELFGEQVASKAALPWLDLVQADLEAAGHAIGVVDLCAVGCSANRRPQRLWFVGHPIGEGLEGQRSGYHTAQGHGEGAIRPATETGEPGRLADADRDGRKARGEAPEAARHGGASGTTVGDAGSEPTDPTNGFWRDADWLGCRDGKWRPVEPGTFPLAHGAAARVGRLRGYGNAINAEVAAAFIEAYLTPSND